MSAAGALPDSLAAIAAGCCDDYEQSQAVAGAMRMLQERAALLQARSESLQEELEALEVEELMHKEETLANSLALRSEAEARERALSRKLETLQRERNELHEAEVEKEERVARLQAKIAACEKAKADESTQRTQQQRHLQERLDSLEREDAVLSAKLEGLTQQVDGKTSERQALRESNSELSQSLKAGQGEVNAAKQAFQKLVSVVETETAVLEKEVAEKLAAARAAEEELSAEHAALAREDEELDRELQAAGQLLEQQRPEKPSLRIPEHPTGITAVSCRPKPRPDERASISELERDISALSRKCRRTLEQVTTPSAAEDNAQEVASLTSLIDQKTNHLARLKRSRQAAIRSLVIDSL